MTLSDLVQVLDKDQCIYVWFSDDIIGRGSISILLKRREINTILDYNITNIYVIHNELHIYTDFK